MSASRRLARPMLASMFVVGGLNSLRDPSGPAKAAEKVGVPIAEKVPGLPTDPETLVRINGGVQFGAGLLLAMGKLPRLSSLALLGSLAPTTLAGHSFWEHDDDTERRAQRIHFLKNVGLAGGLLLSAFDTDGAPSLGWRARRRAERAAAVAIAGRAAVGNKAADGRAAAADAIGTLAEGAKAAGAGKHAGKAAAAVQGGRAAKRAAAKAAKAAAAAEVGGKAAKKAAGKAAKAGAVVEGGKAAKKVASTVTSGRAASTVTGALHQAPDLAESALRTGRAAATAAASAAAHQAPELAATARATSRKAAKQARKAAVRASKLAQAQGRIAAVQAADAARAARSAA